MLQCDQLCCECVGPSLLGRKLLPECLDLGVVVCWVVFWVVFLGAIVGHYTRDETEEIETGKRLDREQLDREQVFG